MLGSGVSVLNCWLRISALSRPVSMVHMRRVRQRAATISSTRSVSAGVAGAWILSNLLRTSSNWKGSSQSRRILPLPAVRPCLIALRDDFSLPSAVVGPRDFAPLARAVSDFKFDTIFFSWLDCISPVQNFEGDFGRFTFVLYKLWKIVKT